MNRLDHECNLKRPRVETTILTEEDPYTCQVPVTTALQITDSEFLQRSSYYTRCVTFILPKAPHITDNGLIPFFNGRTLLQTVELWHCHKITDAVLWTLGTNCPALRKVSIIDSPITDAGIEALLKRRPNIETVELSGCKNLTDRSLYAIANSCRKIYDLSIVGCPSFTLPAFKKVLDMCKTLRGIDFIWGNPQVTQDWLLAITASGNDDLSANDAWACTQNE